MNNLNKLLSLINKLLSLIKKARADNSLWPLMAFLLVIVLFVNILRH